MKWMTIVTAVLVVFAGALMAEPATQPAGPPVVGDRAADFTLSTPAGRSIRLSSVREQNPVVLIVLRGWPGYQCPICTDQVAKFMAQQKELADAGAQVILVYPGPADHLKAHAHEFIEGKSLPSRFFFVIDPNYRFTNAYHLRWDAPNETAYPSTFVIDREGVVRFAQISQSHGGRAEVGSVLKVLQQLKQSKGD